MNDPTRRADLAKIHIAVKELALSRDDYTALLRNVFKASSASELDAAGRQRLLSHFRRLGWQAQAVPQTRARPKRPTPSEDAAPLVRRIRAQLISLGRLPDTYADGIAKQMFGDEAPQFFEWLEPTRLHKVSQALGYEQNRQGAPTW